METCPRNGSTGKVSATFFVADPPLADSLPFKGSIKHLKQV